MSREKQIEKMAQFLCNDCADYGTCKYGVLCEGNLDVATNLYNAGYRKQIEGEWVVKKLTSTSKRGREINYSTHQCSVCGTWNGRHTNNFCPNCGAKMKGGAE